MYKKLMATRAMVEANDTVMATLGEYDALWDGVLAPEIVDAEYYDWDDDLKHPFILTSIVKMPVPLKYHSYPPLVEGLARNDALDALKAVVVEKGGRYIYRHQDGELRESLMSIELDWDGGFDHPIDIGDDEGDDERAITYLLRPSVGAEHIARCEARDLLLDVVVAAVLRNWLCKLDHIDIDEGFYDCPFQWGDLGEHTDRGDRAFNGHVPYEIGVENIARCEARDLLMTLVSRIGRAHEYLQFPLRDINVDGMLHDCPGISMSSDFIMFGYPEDSSW
jgi:hypothetical protein